jgi:tetratricopeptide (TPR) repeat protein
MSRTKRSSLASGRKPSTPAPGPRPKLSPTPETRSLSLPVAAGLLAVVCAVAYWNSLRAEFLLDNQSIILQDPRLRAVDWHSVRNIFAFNYWWPTFESDLFRPLTTLSYWFNYSVLGNGENPFGYHAVNLLLHWTNAVLAFALVRTVTRRAWAALFTAAVFACHPLTVESVTNVVGRADLLAGMSILGGLCLYRRFLNAAGPPPTRAEQARPLRTITGLGAICLAGVFCKESAVVLPALMLLHDVAFPPAEGPTLLATIRRSAARVWPAYLAVLPGLAVLLWARWAMFHNSPIFAQNGADNPIAIAGFWTAVMTAVKVAGYYLALLVWPATLSCDYSYNQIMLFGGTLTSGQDAHAWLALAVLIGLLAAAAIAWRRHRAVTFFLGFAAITFLPTANLLFPIGTIMAERLMYVPLFGLAAAGALTLAAAGQRFLNSRPEGARGGWTIAGKVAAAAVVVALASRTIARNEDWTSSFQLWSSAARATPNNFKVYRVLASMIMASDPSGGRVDEALEMALRGLRIVEQAPLPLPHMPGALYADVGWYYTRKAEKLTASGQRDEAQAVLGEALKRLRQAEEIDREMNRRGREKLLKLGWRPEAIHDVGNAVIYRNLGSAYLLAGDPLQAITALSYLQRIQPTDYDAHFERGVAEAAAAQFEQGRGNQQQAEEHLEQAVVNLIAATILNPDHDTSWQVLTRVYEYVAPSPPAVVVVEGRRTLNVQNPRVPQHLRQACSQLVRQMLEGGRQDDARMWRERMINELHVPPETFAPLQPARRPVQ